LNLGFTVLEIIGGFLTNSVAILSDAVHDLGDTLALGLSWRLERLSDRGRSNSLTFGYRRFSVLGALTSAIVLIGGSVFILSEAIPRLLDPEAVSGPGMLIIAIVGVAVNGAAVLRLRGGVGLNQRVVFLHLIEDVLGWAAVLIGSIVIMALNLPVLDPILSVAITIFILAKIIPNLRATLRIFLQYTPDDVDVQAISAELSDVEDVSAVHDVHLWTLDGNYTVFTAHVVVDKPVEWTDIEEIKERLRERAHALGISHATFEFEPSDRVCDECDL
jgi:cobalt-zinc-cadmium efflux system protein